ncbi:hypothetical protein M2322_000282 [Rhodoblastus acidophilus]|uniref:hypothetical protein n=1 Tax=Rhodoblastus acidophilus TaxID=1074 RepID=UPI002225068D|nr:hypothetical protein [Rhodoblastus acidophilus]MCW2314762.1 hypothetical protein [Rhodoblastus acidophilus]
MRGDPRHLAGMARIPLLIWGAGLTAVAFAAALWAAYGPLVFVNALNAAWTCF